MLSIVSANGWGADSQVLRSLYISLIRPKIDYASFLYETASKTQLLKLDRLQYAASRIILRVLKCTPVMKLEVEANLQPLYIHRKYLLMKYAYRAAMIPKHPFNARLANYYPFQFYDYIRQPKQIAGRCDDEFKNIRLVKSDIPHMTMINKYKPLDIQAKTSLALSSKANIMKEHWQQLHKNHIDGFYADRKQVYTDGSVCESSEGCAVWCSEFNILAKLSTYTVIFRAELYVVYCALNFIRNKKGLYIVFIDSLSCIRHYRNLRKVNTT